MGRAAKSFMIFYWCYIIIYGCCFIAFFVTRAFEHVFVYILPFHFFGMIIGIPMLIILFYDLYKRDFANPNAKVTWTILMLVFWPSIPVYLYRCGFRPRQQVTPAQEEVPVWFWVLLAFVLFGFTSVFASMVLWVLYPVIEHGGFPLDN